MDPDLEDAKENAKRRALFFIRHLYLGERFPVTPNGTMRKSPWSTSEISACFLGLSGERLQPDDSVRETWPKAFGRGLDQLEAAFISKIDSICDRFDQENEPLGTVLLIGVSETEPLTVLDGNHRLMAAILSSPHKLGSLRFICGLSPRMTECCWYRTNLMTLFRYARNVLTHSTRNPAAELARLL